MFKKFKPFAFSFLITTFIIGSIRLFVVDPSSQASLTIDEARFFAAERAGCQSPLEPSSFEDLRLPHNWSVSHSDMYGEACYRIDMEWFADDALYAAFIPRINMNAAMYLNQIEIANTGRFEEPMSRNWNRPWYVQIPASLLKPGNNRLDIRIKAYPNDGGGISRIYIGQHELLYPVYVRWHLLKIESSVVVAFLAFVGALLTLSVWFHRRQESMYGWFALSALCCSLFLSNHFLRDVPLPHAIWEWSVHALVGIFVYCLFVFSRRFTGSRANNVERWLRYYMLVSLIIILLMPEKDLNSIFSVWHLGTLAMATNMVVIIWRHWKWHRTFESQIVLQGVLLNLMLGLHDWMIMTFHLQGTLPSAMQFGPPLMLGAIGWVLIIQFTKARNEADNFNVILKLRVKDAEQELARKHEQILILEQNRAQSEERERIMCDLHDGLGGYLLSAQSIAELSNVDQPLQEALQDAQLWLRSSIDALDDNSQDMNTLLATLRYRMTSRLQSCGLEVRWCMDEIECFELPSQQRLHILRIIQEALTNIVKHANASEVRIDISVEDSALRICIADNGKGLPEEPYGYGIRNMKERAAAIDGSLGISSGEPGTIITLLIPGKVSSHISLVCQ